MPRLAVYREEQKGAAEKMVTDYEKILEGYDALLVERYEADKIDSQTLVRLSCKLSEWWDAYYKSEVSE